MGPVVAVVFASYLAIAAPLSANPAGQMIRQGNALYDEGQYTEAINKYNEALVDSPTAAEPKFNKANSYYRLDDLAEAMDLYQEVAAETKDMALVADAKYNLGNCFFQRGTKQRDADLQKALEDMEASIVQWRQVLDIEPEDEKAARNIEVARLTIKDILDQLQKQQEEQQQNQQGDQQEQQDQQQQDGQNEQQDQQGQQDDQQQSQEGQQQDENQNGDQEEENQNAGKDQQQDPNQAAEQQPVEQPQDGEPQQVQEVEIPDTTAQEILDREQQLKEQRQMRRVRRAPRVEKDW